MPEAAQPPTAPMPLWVKLFIAMAIVAAVGFLVLHLTGNAPMSH